MRPSQSGLRGQGPKLGSGARLVCSSSSASPSKSGQLADGTCRGRWPGVLPCGSPRHTYFVACRSEFSHVRQKSQTLENLLPLTWLP